MKCKLRHGDTAGTSGVTVGVPEVPLRYTTSRCWARQCRRLGRAARYLIVLVYVPTARRGPARRGCHSCDELRANMYMCVLRCAA